MFYNLSWILDSIEFFPLANPCAFCETIYFHDCKDLSIKEEDGLDMMEVVYRDDSMDNNHYGLDMEEPQPKLEELGSELAHYIQMDQLKDLS